MRLLGAELVDSAMPARAIPPVLVLVTDGYPTDDFRASMQTFLALPWAKRAVRLAIAIGRDANVAVLNTFIANPAIAPLTANNPEALVRYISWASDRDPAGVDAARGGCHPSDGPGAVGTLGRHLERCLVNGHGQC